jgi:hypothetical protein
MTRKLSRVLLPALAAAAFVISGGGAALADEGPTEGSVTLSAPTNNTFTLMEYRNVGGGNWHYGDTGYFTGWSNY